MALLERFSCDDRRPNLPLRFLAGLTGNIARSEQTALNEIKFNLPAAAPRKSKKAKNAARSITKAKASRNAQTRHHATLPSIVMAKLRSKMRIASARNLDSKT